MQTFVLFFNIFIQGFFSAILFEFFEKALETKEFLW